MSPPTAKRAAPLVALTLGLLALSAPVAAPAQTRPDEAEAHFGRGTALHRQGRFAEAAEEFLVAWRLSHTTELLYNAYVAYRDAADTRRAADALREYLAVEPRARNRPMLQAQLAAMEAQLRAAAPAPGPGPAVAPVPTVAVAAPAPAPVVVVRRPPPVERPRRSIALPVALIAGGGAAIVAGAVLGVTVLSTEHELASSCLNRVCDPSLRAEADSGRTRAAVTDVLLGVGLASAAAGVLVLLLSHGDRSGPVVGAACAPGGCAARLQVTF
jgi:tetratricopeptide (TPR) repeat protein